MFTVTKRFCWGVLYLAIGSLVFSACKKEAETIVVVCVRNDANELVENAQVILSAPTSNGELTTIHDTCYTNAKGEALFNYKDMYQKGQYGVALLDIEAYKDTLDGYGVIQILRETTTTETVFI